MQPGATCGHRRSVCHVGGHYMRSTNDLAAGATGGAAASGGPAEHSAGEAIRADWHASLAQAQLWLFAEHRQGVYACACIGEAHRAVGSRPSCRTRTGRPTGLLMLTHQRNWRTQ